MIETAPILPAEIVPVILCGGSGTRLWPLSRKARAKPFIPLVGTDTLFEQALERCSDTRYFKPPLIVTGAAYVDHARQGAAARSKGSLIVEPVARNTAAAIALAAFRVPGDTVLLVCPSDHHIAESHIFIKRALDAAAVAREGWLVCLGIPARTPETRFGYVRRGVPIGGDAYRLEQFVEKPDLARAAVYLASGEFAWNSGIFAFRAGDYLAELTRYRPDIAQAAGEAVARGVEDADCFHPDAQAFTRINPESIDHAVMEHTTRGAMIEASMGWSDIGTWCAVQVARDRDEAGNSARGPVELVDCHNVLVESDGPRVSVIGLEDAIVVVDGDDIMITTVEAAQRINKLSSSRR